MYDFKLPRNEGLDDCVFSGQDTVMVKAEDVFEKDLGEILSSKGEVMGPGF